ncbi:MAG TPA: cytochrome P450 [Nostocaceae cyanobacterium]|nr:cytochrome P450 [Nostocaceae cyanobacterium]
MLTSTTTPQNYDLLAPEALINPYPLYKQIRDEDPVYFYEKGGFWFLTRYQDVEAGFQDLRLSSDRQILFTSQLQGFDLAKIQNFIKLTSNIIVEKDPPIHTQLRKIAQPGFTVKAIENWRSVIQNITDDLLDQLQDQNNMNVVTDLSLKLPSMVIAKVLNIPEVHRQDFIQWGLDIVEFWGFSDNSDIQQIAQKADEASAKFTNLVAELVRERQQQPGDDIISLLIAACQENGISLEIVPPLCITILTAGHTTTTDVISNGLYALLTNPYQWQLLKENPELINSAVEELIRFDPPLQMMFRVAKEDLSIGGKEIKAGSVVALGIAAANHDPERFTNPEILDITRSPNEHISFGKGIHFCLGVILARMELATCFSTLIRRMPNLRLDPEKPPKLKHHSLVFKGFDSLEVQF